MLCYLDYTVPVYGIRIWYKICENQLLIGHLPSRKLLPQMRSLFMLWCKTISGGKAPCGMILRSCTPSYQMLIFILVQGWTCQLRCVPSVFLVALELGVKIHFPSSCFYRKPICTTYVWLLRIFVTVFFFFINVYSQTNRKEKKRDSLRCYLQ